MQAGLSHDNHPDYREGTRWIDRRKRFRRTNQYSSNRVEQHHRPIKLQYYAMMEFWMFESGHQTLRRADE